MKRSLLKRNTPLRRTPMRRKPHRNPMGVARRDDVLRRDNWTCQASAFGWPTEARCSGVPQVHHITGRGMGGTARSDVHDPERCTTLCPVHHAEVESRRTDAYACGLAERRNR